MIHLDFINRAFDVDRPDIVFFHKDHANSREVVLAWKVIHRCGVDWHHPFRFDPELELGLVDAYGNFTPRAPALGGQRYILEDKRIGPNWKAERIDDAQTIEVVNNLRDETVGCRLTRNQRLVVPVRRLATGDRARFAIPNKELWVGAVWRGREEQKLDRFELENSTTCLDLKGVQRGEVWMVGGGIGASATAYRFHLHSSA